MSLRIVEFPVTEKMKKFIWSPSSAEVFCGNTEFVGGCGVRLYMDRFAGPTFNVFRKHFSFGTAMHEILEKYHVCDEKPPLEKVLDDWLPNLWVASEYKKKFARMFGKAVADKMEANELISVSDFDRGARLPSFEALKAGFPQMPNFPLTLMEGKGKRWMFLGFDSELEEQLFYNKAVKIFTDYYKRDYIKPLSIEDDMLIKLNGVSIRGRIDRVDKFTEESYRVVDYKTSKKMKTVAEMEKDFQMICYHVATKERYGLTDAGIDVGLLYLKPEVKVAGEYVQKPVQLRTAKINKGMIEQAASVIEKADRMVKSGRFHYVDYKGKWKCPWCDHYGLCGK